jgi:hypothetical protein
MLLRCCCSNTPVLLFVPPCLSPLSVHDVHALSWFPHTIDVGGRNAGVGMLLRLCKTFVCARRLS